MDHRKTTLRDFVNSPTIQPHADLVEVQEIDRVPRAQHIQLNPGRVSAPYAIESYKLITVALWGGIWLAGSLGARYIGIHAHKRREWRIRLAKACATLGTLTFCEIGTYAIYKEYEQDPSLHLISRCSDAMREFGYGSSPMRTELFRVANLPVGRELYDPVQLRNSQVKADAPLISRIFFYISWQSHNVWSTRTSRAAMRIWLQAIQPDIRNFDLSPHDLDICVTHLANSLDAWRWEAVGGCSLATYLGTYIFDVQPRTRLWWLRRGSFWGFMVTLYLRVYQHAAYVKNIRDKRGVAAIVSHGMK